MADSGFQGSTCTVNSVSVTPLTKVHYSDNPASAPITGAGDSTEKVATGQHDEAIEVDFVGSNIAGLVPGTKGAGVVNLNDGTTPTTNFSSAIVTKLKISGRLGSAITGSLTVQPTK